jgi:diacylglycerol kinase (ATP)
MRPIIQLVFNPDAGSYSRRKITVLQRALEDAGAEITLAECSAAVRLSIDESATMVCVAGGDGTMRHVVAALAAADLAIPLAQYPTGTINLLAREIAYPTDPTAFARRLLSGFPLRRHYTATLRDQLFLCCASVGPECEAIARHSPRLKQLVGRLAYGLAFLGVMIRWQRHQLLLIADDTSYACEAVYIAKGRYFAGPWSFAPQAALADGQFHVLALGTARRRDYLRFILDLVQGRDPGTRPGTRSLRCTTLSISGAASIGVQADGDIVASLPADVSVSTASTAFI